MPPWNALRRRVFALPSVRRGTRVSPRAYPCSVTRAVPRRMGGGGWLLPVGVCVYVRVCEGGWGSRFSDARPLH